VIPAVHKYLARYAEPEGQNDHRIGRIFGHVIVIPAFDEGESLLRTLQTVPAGPLGDVLTVLVINAPADAPLEVHSRSEELIRRLGTHYQSETVRTGQSAFRWFAHSRGLLLCVDRTGNRPLPKGQGVGLARKIGCDIALQLHIHGSIRSVWIHTTDADVELPADYFERAPLVLNGNAPAALLYPFWHQREPLPPLADAMDRYELFLRYYVLGLAEAGSPYAFHTLGSTLAVHALAYAKVRGFPRRAAGEDFYLLNKLAKVGSIVQLDGAPLIIGGRSSHRVPFGTGAALNQILAAAARGEPYKTYAPEVFLHLKVWLAALNQLSDDEARQDPECYVSSAATLHRGVDPANLYREIADLGFPSALRRIRAISRDPQTLARHLHTWFDAFRTLKLIHRLSRLFPKRELLDALRAAPFTRKSAIAIDNLEVLRRSLMELERPLRPLSRSELPPTKGGFADFADPEREAARRVEDRAGAFVNERPP
jgi:hypothetical protein